MSKADISKAELAQIAAAAGLPRLADNHLDQLQLAVTSARELAQKLPKDLHWSEELSLTFRLPRPPGPAAQSEASGEAHARRTSTP
jgi:hypothetical protein